MFCWHPRYPLGHEQFHRGSHLDEREDEDGALIWPWNDLENVRRWLEVKRGAIEAVPLYLYDHGCLLVTIEDPRISIDPGGWDTTAIGFIYATRTRIIQVLSADPTRGSDRIRRRVRTALRDEVGDYAQALVGA